MGLFIFVMEKVSNLGRKNMLYKEIGKMHKDVQIRHFLIALRAIHFSLIVLA